MKRLDGFFYSKFPREGVGVTPQGAEDGGGGGAHRESWGSALRQKEREELWARAFTLVSIGRNR